MRIGIDARELLGRPTGVGRYLQCLLREWGLSSAVRRSHHFSLYTHDGRLATPPDLPAEVVAVPGSGGVAWEQWTLAAAVGRDRPDVFFGPGYATPLRLPCPSVVAIHDASFAAHPEWFGWREGARRRWLARLSARRASVVLTFSEFSRRELVARLGVPDARIRVVPHGVGLDVTSSRASARRPVVLFVGSILNRRHVAEVIAAFPRVVERLPAARLEVVGENRTWPRQDLEALAAGRAEYVRLRSWIPDGELRALYAEASAFVFLSSYEGFGLTPLEAMAAGVPPVVLDTPVAREVYGDAALYVERPEAGLIAVALVRALSDDSTRDALAQAAPAVVARHRWADAAAATLAAIEEAGRS